VAGSGRGLSGRGRGRRPGAFFEKAGGQWRRDALGAVVIQDSLLRDAHEAPGTGEDTAWERARKRLTRADPGSAVDPQIFAGKVSAEGTVLGVVRGANPF